MPKIKIHPLFILLAVLMLLTGKGYTFLMSITAVLLHEFAHAVAAKGQGYVTSGVTLLPYGAVLSGNQNISGTSEVIIAVAGPLCNFLLAIITVAFWWIIPESLSFTQDFYICNLTIGVFNLIPVFPLDGSRIILGFSKNRAKTLIRLRYAGIIFSILMATYFVYSIFNEINPTMGILAVFLAVGALSGTRADGYAHVLDGSPYLKNYHKGVENKTYYISSDADMLSVFKKTSPEITATFIICNANGQQLCKMSEKEIYMKAANKGSFPKTLKELLD